MSTAPGDNDSPDRTPPAANEGPKPTFEPGVAPEVPDSGTDHPSDSGAPAGGATDTTGVGSEAAATPAGQHDPAVRHDQAASGVFSTETFGIVGLVLLAVTVFSGQLLEILTSLLLVGGQPIGADQVTQISTQIMLGGAAALLTVVVSALALALSGARTRPWGRWVSAAALITGLLFVILAAVSYLLIPDAAPVMPPMME
ncbi:phage holin family protein [Nocardiopsis sp. NPDC058631]|uniref:phage holin family protein n=1 Tax=Nocardiopsis sp. NPDC058631 TaxID=3346566 RepID=UPI00365B7FD6